MEIEKKNSSSLKRTSWFSNILKSQHGLSLIEVLVVIVILGIIGTIAFPTARGIIEKAREDSCEINIGELERMYETHLETERIEHTDVLFTQFIEEHDRGVCGPTCDMVYEQGTIQCSDQGNEEEVPFL